MRIDTEKGLLYEAKNFVQQPLLCVHDSLNITDLHPAVLTVDGLFQIVDILNEDQMPAHIDHTALLQLGEHPIETLPRRCGVVRELLIRERYGDQYPLVRLHPVAVRKTEKRRAECSLLSVEHEVAEFEMLLAHVHPDQLQQRDSEVRMLFEIRLQYGKLDGVDLGGTACNRTEEIGRLILVDRQLPDETPLRRKTQRQNTPRCTGI